MLLKKKDASTSLVAHTNPLAPFIQERKAKKSLHKFTFQRSYRETPKAAALEPLHTSLYRRPINALLNQSQAIQNIRHNIKHNRAVEILFDIVHCLAMIQQWIDRPKLDTCMKMDML